MTIGWRSAKVIISKVLYCSVKSTKLLKNQVGKYWILEKSGKFPRNSGIPNFHNLFHV